MTNPLHDAQGFCHNCRMTTRVWFNFDGRVWLCRHCKGEER